MAKSRDRNYISIWFWIFAMFVMAIPIINVVMTIIWAFTGENESRQNYFRALIVLFFLVMGLIATLASLGTLPAITHYLQASLR